MKWQLINEFNTECNGKYLFRVVETWDAWGNNPPGKRVRYYCESYSQDSVLSVGPYLFTPPDFTARGHDWRRILTHFVVLSEPDNQTEVTA